MRLRNLLHRVGIGWVLFLVMGAGSAWAKVEISCTEDLRAACGGAGVAACFRWEENRIWIQCTGPIREGLTCDQLPKKIPPAIQVIRARCVLKHECEHAENFELGFRGTDCMDEYSAYRQTEKCFRESFHEFCPGQLPSGQCDEIREELDFARQAQDALRCLHQGGSASQCERSCDRKHLQNCRRVLRQYAGCAKQAS